MKKILFLLSTTALALSACTTLDVRLEQKSTATSNPTAVATVAIITPTNSPSVYKNTKYGFSMEYPANFEINADENNDVTEIGEKIRGNVTDKNPLECRGDCDIVESKTPVTIAGFEMTKVMGYIGSIGGNIPQHYLRYILQKDQHYYTFTLYALSFRTKINDPSKIWPLEEKDITTFEQILATFKFTN